jgi:general secretion pathway protein A
LIPTRPPIRLEEGLVEVGWEGDLEAELTRPEIPPSEPEIVAPGEAERNEELVEDRYAALQAWAEWSRNRERSVPPAADPVAHGVAPDDEDEPGPAQSDTQPMTAPSVRAEPPQDFAPYSQLFSRLRRSS